MVQAILPVYLPCAGDELAVGVEESTIWIEIVRVIKAVPHPTLHQTTFVIGIAYVTVLSVGEVIKGTDHEVLNKLGTVHRLPVAYRMLVQHAILGHDQRLVLLPPILHPLAHGPDLLIKDIHVCMSAIIVRHKGIR